MIKVIQIYALLCLQILICITNTFSENAIITIEGGASVIISAYEANKAFIINSGSDDGELIVNSSGSFTAWSREALIDFTISGEGDTLFPAPQLQARLFLQGYYLSNGEMSLKLGEFGALPKNSPYDNSVIGTINNQIVDWLLIELRQNTTGPIITQRSFLLRKDGYLVGIDGLSTLLSFEQITEGDYYVVIRHRNHIAIMSSEAVSLNINSPILYDFSIGLSKYYGNQGGVALQSGIWGMWAGDVDQNGLVEYADFLIWASSAKLGYKGYCSSDINGDSFLTTKDYFYWFKNMIINPYSQVPYAIP